jgi:hypothetical protein
MRTRTTPDCSDRQVPTSRGPLDEAPLEQVVQGRSHLPEILVVLGTDEDCARRRLRDELCAELQAE